VTWEVKKLQTLRVGVVLALLVTGIGLTVSTASADQYSARRASSVKVVWRHRMAHHTYRLKRDARYSRHLRVKYVTKQRDKRQFKRATWVTDAHQKVYDRYTKKTAIYYHVHSLQGEPGGWVWRGNLKPAQVKRDRVLAGQPVGN